MKTTQQEGFCRCAQRTGGSLHGLAEDFRLRELFGTRFALESRSLLDLLLLLGGHPFRREDTRGVTERCLSCFELLTHRGAAEQWIGQRLSRAARDPSRRPFSTPELRDASGKP